MSVLQVEAPPNLPVDAAAASGDSCEIPPEAIPPIEQRLGPGKFPGLRQPVRSVLWFIHVAFGTACLILVLAILAAIPGLNILTLGYLLEPQRRVAVGGRLRDGFPLMTLAPRLGLIVFFSLILLIPVRIQASRVSDAAVILGESSQQVQEMSGNLRILQWTAASVILLIVAGTFQAAGRNNMKIETERKSFQQAIRWILKGKFLLVLLAPIAFIVRVIWSLRSRQGWQDLYLGMQAVLTVLRPFHHFLIGLKAFFGAVIWLIIPAGLMVAYSAPNRTSPFFGLLSFLGVLIMIPVTAWLPLLQVHQAVTGKFSAVFSVRTARQIIRNAPTSWMLTTVLLYAMTFPLYLAKIRLLPADAMLVLTPFFIILTYPARILVAWAYHRGMSQERPAWLTLRWGIRLTMLPLLLAHAIFLFFTPTISELGRKAPFENQAFLGPVPYAQWQRQ